jgi:hypothetical protein
MVTGLLRSLAGSFGYRHPRELSTSIDDHLDGVSIMKDKIYFHNSTTAADMIRRRDAVRAVSGTPGLRFIYQVHAPKPDRVRRSNLLPDRSIIEPSPIEHKSICEVV